MPEPLLLLHGFTQTGSGWREVIRHLPAERYRPIAPDLRGHGEAGEFRPIDLATCAEDVAGLAGGPFVLAGYSMGGRVALHVALAHPELVLRLVLISTTAGIEDPGDRAWRQETDAALAAWMKTATMEEVADRWAAQPLFEGQPRRAAAMARADRLRNDPVDLAAALRGMGTGVMNPLWWRLGELSMPVTVLAGERDAKFAVLAQRLADEIPDATLRLVPDAGHALHLEAPAAVAKVIEGS